MSKSTVNSHISPEDYHKLDYIKLKVRKTGHPIGNHIHLHEITYHRKPLIIQTPKYYLPFGVSKSYQSNSSDKEKYHIDHSIRKTTTYDPFPSFIEEVDKQISQQLNELLNSGSKKLAKTNTNRKQMPKISVKSCEVNVKPKKDIKLSPSLRHSEDSFYPPKLRTKIDSQIHLQVYDIYGAPQSQDYIVPGSWAKSLIYLKNVWYSTQTGEGGLTWYILQTKVETPVPILNKCLIEDESWDGERLCSICYSKILKASPKVRNEEQTSNKAPVFPPPPPPLPKDKLKVMPSRPTGYEKYFKMLKLGIPIVAVIQKCQMDGFDPIYLTSKDLTPPPLPSKNAGLPFSAKDLLNKRKKLTNAEDREVEGKMTLNLKPRDPRVPSLNMVLNRLTSLRKTKRREKLLKDEEERAKNNEQSEL